MSRFRAFFLKSSWKWESYCHQCGKCCYTKYRHGGVLLIDYSSPCRYLDTSTNRCTVYEHRLRVNDSCRKVTILHALFSRYLPEDCGYVERFRKKRYFSRERN